MDTARFLNCGHSEIFERTDTGGCRYCTMCYAVAKESGEQSARRRYHDLLDQAMNATKSGESFLPRFVGLVVAELLENKKFWCDCGVSLGIRVDHEAECAGAYLHPPKKS